MDIGYKIKKARTDAGLTQEQVAEALGVSRQTLSNWENQKTYPDIVSVVKMSDLYHISLDHLLKEEKDMYDYLDYLEESTNTVKSNDRKAKLILISAYLGIWAFTLIAFWIFTGPADAMAYSIMFLWILFPIATFVFSFIIGKNGYWGKFRWVSVLPFGIMYMMAGYATTMLANMVTNEKFRMPNFTMLLAGAIISCVGLAIGIGIDHLKKKGRRKCRE